MSPMLTHVLGAVLSVYCRKCLQRFGQQLLVVRLLLVAAGQPRRSSDPECARQDNVSRDCRAEVVACCVGGGPMVCLACATHAQACVAFAESFASGGTNLNIGPEVAGAGAAMQVLLRCLRFL